MRASVRCGVLFSERACNELIVNARTQNASMDMIFLQAVLQAVEIRELRGCPTPSGVMAPIDNL